MTENSEESEETPSMYYGVNDVPAWHITILFGFQNYLMTAGVISIIPFQLLEKLCLKPHSHIQADLVSTIIFVSGIVTILQSTFGTRLPILQGGSFNFLFPILAILSLEKWKCDPDDKDPESWKLRMREIQGAIVSSAFQVFIGFFGIVGVFVKFVTPITIASSILTLGLSLFKTGANFASSNWLVSISTIVLTIVFSQYLPGIKVEIPFTKSPKRNGLLRYPIFQVFPILLAILIVWLVCFILTVLEWLPNKNDARTDAKSHILSNVGWFRVPYPFQWGFPTVSTSSVFGILAGVLSGIIESVGDYYACARTIGAKPPPVHAINRGIFIEGLGCIIAGIWGTGNGTTSYSENIGAIGLTRVGSRRVIQVTGLIMMVCSMFTKLGAIFIIVPRPIVGGVICVSFSFITAIGISNLKSVDLNSVRNLFIVGFSTFFSFTVSEWIERNPGVINIGEPVINQILEIVLATGIFLSGVLALFLDNTIPGSLKERGLLDWPGYNSPKEFSSGGNNIPQDQNTNLEDLDETYDLPFWMGFIKITKWTSWIPISPSFNPKHYSKCLPRSLNKGEMQNIGGLDA